MTDWSGGYGGGRPANARIPVKVHRHVSLIRTSERFLTRELMARPKLSRAIVGQLTDEVLIVVPGKVAEVVDELRKMGHTPQVIGSK